MKPTVIVQIGIFLLVLGGLSCKGEETKIDEAIARLSSAEVRERSDAAIFLAGLGKRGEPAFEPLVKALSDPSWKVKNSATYALYRLGSKEAIEAIVKTIPEHIKALQGEDADIRWHAATGLGYMGPHAGAAVPALAEATKDPQVAVQNAANYALKKIIVPPEVKK